MDLLSWFQLTQYLSYQSKLVYQLILSLLPSYPRNNLFTEILKFVGHHGHNFVARLQIQIEMADLMSSRELKMWCSGCLSFCPTGVYFDTGSSFYLCKPSLIWAPLNRWTLKLVFAYWYFNFNIGNQIFFNCTSSRAKSYLLCDVRNDTFYFGLFYFYDNEMYICMPK